MVGANLTELFSTLITGLHILNYNGVLDAYGHMSVRNPNNASNFFMSRDLAPALVANTSDIVEYQVSTAAPLDPHAPDGFIERYIHSELFKRFPGINAVVHSHSPDVVPYTFSGVPLRASIHMAGFLGDTVPVYNISTFYATNNVTTHQDLLIRTPELGADLATSFSSSEAIPNATQTDAAHAVVLMQNHGFTTVATSIELAVMQAIYTQTNAGIQTTALTIRGAYGSPAARARGARAQQAGVEEQGLAYLTTQQTVQSWMTMTGTADRPWRLWKHQVEANSAYQNLLDANQTRPASPVL